jgi:hypothetical protein
MLDDANEDVPAFDLPDPDAVYAGHVETCKRLGIEPVPPLRAEDLIAKWSDAIAVGRVESTVWGAMICCAPGRPLARKGAQ